MFVNLTPHTITLQSVEGTRIDILPFEQVARIDSKSGEKLIVEACGGFADGIAIYSKTEYGQPVGLPEPVVGVTYLVSALFAGRVGNRTDVVYPGTGPADGCIRENGLVSAVTRLIRA